MPALGENVTEGTKQARLSDRPVLAYDAPGCGGRQHALTYRCNQFHSWSPLRPRFFAPVKGSWFHPVQKQRDWREAGM